MSNLPDTVVNRMRNIMELEIEGDNAEAIFDRIATRILEAETDDEMFEAAESTAEETADVVNLPLRILSISYRKSSHEGPLGVYTVIESVDADGIPHTWRTSAVTPQIMLFKWNQKNQFPKIVVVIGRTTQSGNTMYLFRRPTPSELRTFAPLEG